MSEKRTLHRATQAGEPRLGFEKISVTIPLLTPSHMTPQIKILLIIRCGAWLSE